MRCARRYFAPPEATDALKGSTLRSAKFALGPSFGTLSLGSLVLTLIELARQALQQCVSAARCLQYISAWHIFAAALTALMWMALREAPSWLAALMTCSGILELSFCSVASPPLTNSLIFNS